MLNEMGVTQVTIPLLFRLDHVHYFLAESADVWTIIDAGLNNQTSRDTWKPIIEKYEISDIFLTHDMPEGFLANNYESCGMQED
ncbi:hypothetical protein ACQKL5_10535 [Peribacillus sp. NPDC097675]|uniref:hypothetical protein n=1 Tax=Peribacillus sp. NPDC097675 TaxID=3390618 RepID=UPI003D06AF86